MKRSLSFHLKDLLILSVFGAVLFISGCQPAAAPPEGVTSVATVVITEVVEVEGEETVVEEVMTRTPPSAAEEPAAEPQATSFPSATLTSPPTSPSPTEEPLPEKLDIEDRRVEVEWPAHLEPEQSASVRLTFVPVDGGLAIITEFPENQLTVTQVAVKQLPSYTLTAIANLDGVGFTVSPSLPQEYLITPGEPLTWLWTITPKQTGQQQLTLTLKLRWASVTGPERREGILYSRTLPVQVGSPANPNRIIPFVLLCLPIWAAFIAIAFLWRIFSRPAKSPAAQPPVHLSPARTPTHPLPTPPIIEPPSGLTLTAQENTLLQTLFARYKRLVIEREFLSGYSGARTFLAVPIRSDGRTDAHTIIKISPVQTVQREYENYENYVKTTLPPATARIQQPPVTLNGLAALQYTFLGTAGYTPLSLRQALLANPDPRLLWKLFDTFAPNWWMQHSPYVFRLAQEYDRKLPTHYVLEPADGSPDATLDGHLPPDPAGLLTPGILLSLKNFPQAELRPDGKSYSLTGTTVPGHPPLRARWLSPDLPKHPVGRLVATRQTLLAETAAPLNLFTLPDPLHRLPELLNTRVNGTQSLIHGDLNVENILAGPGDLVWLIDFAETRDGHTLYDFAHLHAELIAHIIAPQISNPKDYLAILTDGADPLLSAVREMASRCLFDPRQTREYDLALAITCLGALKFANLDDHARHLLYLTSAHLVQSL